MRVELWWNEEERGSFDARVACYGARPRTGWLATFVDRDARGFVRVDDHFRTSVENVWAAGDCVAKDAISTSRPTPTSRASTWRPPWRRNHGPRAGAA